MILNCTTAATELRAAPNDNFGLIAKIVVITVLSHTHDCLDKSSSKVKRRKKGNILADSGKHDAVIKEGSLAFTIRNIQMSYPSVPVVTTGQVAVSILHSSLRISALH